MTNPWKVYTLSPGTTVGISYQYPGERGEHYLKCFSKQHYNSSIICSLETASRCHLFTTPG